MCCDEYNIPSGVNKLSGKFTLHNLLEISAYFFWLHYNCLDQSLLKSLKEPEEKGAVAEIPRDAYLVQPRGNHHYFGVLCCHSSEVKYTSQIIPVKQEIFPMNKSQAHLPTFLSLS